MSPPAHATRALRRTWARPCAQSCARPCARFVLGFGLSFGFELRLRLCLEFRLNTRPEVACGARRHAATQLRRQRIGDWWPPFRRGRTAQRGFKLLRHLRKIVVSLRWSGLWHRCRRTRSRFGAGRSMLGLVQARRQFRGQPGKAVSRTRTRAWLRRQPGFFGRSGAVGAGCRRGGRLARWLQRPAVLECRGRPAGGFSRSGARGLARDITRRNCTHDIRFHHQIGGPADHQKMFDVVAANQDQAPASIDRCGVDHREPWLTSTGRCSEPA